MVDWGMLRKREVSKQDYMNSLRRDIRNWIFGVGKLACQVEVLSI